ncbi:MAG: AAA family ATPase [Candidatus Gastranaerophilales bacterium]|nr:AAA family ATPase [Candidatus Gastranaerophilales bacterium]
MSILEKELHQNLLKNLISVIEKDKKRQVPVIKFMRQGFLLSVAQRLTKEKRKVHFIGITGESASGKSTFVRTIIKKIRDIEATKNKKLLNFISSDNYFNDISEKIKKYGSFNKLLEEENYNPDAPESFQLDLMRKDLITLSEKKNVYIPEYRIDGTGRSIPNSILIESAPIIMSEGIAVFYPAIRDLFDIRVYVEVDEELRLERYIKRAAESRNQSREDALEQYETINKSAQIYLRPQRQYADIIINGHAEISDIEQIAEDLSLYV